MEVEFCEWRGEKTKAGLMGLSAKVVVVGVERCLDRWLTSCGLGRGGATVCFVEEKEEGK